MLRAVNLWGLIESPDTLPKLERVFNKFGAEVGGRSEKQGYHPQRDRACVDIRQVLDLGYWGSRESRGLGARLLKQKEEEKADNLGEYLVR